ncbi:DUF2931 family protein [Neisseria zoodegmatis]|uniref:DUF2931 domain-containing protein n=2 Tax=Neisseria TaxID=482 RepID=A0AB38DNR4_9NEIS|nr:DUF2931 family protein [Neisseria zoodegmatis]OSI07620.1 hypothetical protein BWD10_11975 [Neisseria zoodegmatis]SNU78815.1 Uncharacterised protein [Neisseria zoodegmatis]
MKFRGALKNWLLSSVAIIYLLIGIMYWGVDEVRKMNGFSWGVRMADATFVYQPDKSLGLGADAIYATSKYSTDFYRNDGTIVRSIDGGGGAWGRGDIPMGGNPRFGLLPQRLGLTYYSQFENKFYQLDEPLPTEQIKELMTKEFFHLTIPGETTADRAVYDTLEIAIAPDGWVTLNAFTASARKELVSWQAEQVFPTIEEAKQSGNSHWESSLRYDLDPKNRKEYLNRTMSDFSNFYYTYMVGHKKISAEWYKQMQVKYPWYLDIEVDGGEWNGEYYVEFANTEKGPVIGKDAVVEAKNTLKAIPTAIWFWVIEKETGKRWSIKLNMIDIPAWQDGQYLNTYDDKSLNKLYRIFQTQFPGRTRTNNEQVPASHDFGVLKLKFNGRLKLTDAYLEKGEQKIHLPEAKLHQAFETGQTVYD